MRRIFAVMVIFGLAIGLIFPLVVSPFVVWIPARRLEFQIACLIAGFAVGSFCYFIIKTTLYRQKLELETAKDHFTSLTESAIQSKDWSIKLDSPDIPTCWEVKNCDFSGCPAYGLHNVRCWLLAGTFCGGEVQGRFAQKLNACTECEVYTSTVRQDPISEIRENFKSLMWEVHEREEQLAEANRQLRELAITDSLTGLKNHGDFQEHLEQEIARAKRFSHVLSVIMLDLDHFKDVNDRFGHPTGDTVLRSIGRFLKDETRDMDYCARYGGEEFVIVLPETAGGAASVLAEKLRKDIRKKVAAETGLPEDYVSASFGIADYPGCATTKDSLIAAADTALLFSKENGRDQVTYFLDLVKKEQHLLRKAG